MKKHLLTALVILALLLALAPAAFADGRTCVLTFDANGGWFEENKSTTIQNTYPAGRVVFGSGYQPVHSDRHTVFDGRWYHDAACTDVALGELENGSYSSVIAMYDATLYAGWTKGWVVTLNAGDGYFEDGTKTKEVKIPRGKSVGYADQAPIAADSGMVFDHWKLADGTNADGYIPTGDITVYAQYIPCYTVRYYANGGYFYEEGNKTTEFQVREGDTIWGGDPIATHPDRHMIFNGWYYDAACSKPALGRNAYYTVTGDLTLYAGWTEGYCVSFHANGGTGAPEPQTVAPKSSIRLTNSVPARNGWFFVGWADSAKADAPQYFPNEAIRAQADMTLYAVWKKPDCILPADLTEIGTEAFRGADFTFVQIPEGTEHIRSYAFADCANLKYVAIMGYDPDIQKTAFDKDSGLVIIGSYGSPYELARDKGCHYIPLY